MTTRRKPRYQTVEGLTIAEMFSPECVREALHYKPRSDDIFIVTYPKCGTTWSQTILMNLFRSGQGDVTIEEFHSATPFFELVGMEVVEKMQRPGAIKTHLPFNLQPYSPDAKYIYVARNPKDCCVSFYHHTKNFDGYDYVDGSFDDFFELFINGEVDFGDYFDHILSWYDHRNDPNVLFLTYEEMKKDTPGSVLKMAKFIGEEYGDLLEKDPTKMDSILHYSSFQYMKDTFNMSLEPFAREITDEEIDKLPFPKGLKHTMKFRNKLNLSNTPSEKINFVRKGVVGDWRSHFSRDQSERVDERFEKVLGHTELAELWKKDMEFH